MEGKEQLFRDKNVKPTEQLIAESLGEGYAIYQRFVETLENEGISLMDWRYYQAGCPKVNTNGQRLVGRIK